MFTTKNLIILTGKQAVIAFVAVAIALVSVFFLAREIDRASNMVVQNRKLAEMLSRRTELLSVLARDMAIVGENDIVIENAFLPADNILEFILSLEKTALRNNATQSFRFGTPVSAEEIAPFPISTIIYHNTLSLNIVSLSNYLKIFEAMPYFTRIDSLNFTSRDATGWNTGGTATYSATLYTKTNN